MAKFNAEKAISANSKGIVISYRDANKHKFIRYESSYVKNIQISGTAKYQKLHAENFNEKQQELYQKTIYGFKAYSKEEINALNENSKQQIIVNYTKVQRILNKFKQDVLYKSVDNFLLAMFPKSNFVKEFTSVSGHLKEPVLEEEFTFDELGISKFAIANKLMEYSLLPKNFYQLT
jgi:hypothetical protein